jgi:hypothetical protein
MRMDQKDNAELLNKAKKIEKQVERWDLYAKIVPTFFLIACFILLVFKIASFDTVFWVGMSAFAATAVTWWFWTIFTIRYLVRTLSRASTGLLEVSNELRDVRKDYFDNETNNNNADL